MQVAARLKQFARARLFGKPRGIVSQADYAALPGTVYARAEPADPRPRPTPRRLGAIGIDFSDMIEPLPELGVFALPMGKALGPAGLAFDRDGRIVRETTWYGNDLHEGQLPGAFPRPTRVPGVCLSLVSQWGNVNFGHYLMDCLSRVGIAERAGWPLAKIDRFYIGKPVSGSARRMLQMLRIDEARCVWANEVPSIVADTLLVTTYPGTKRNYAPVVPETLRRPFEHQEPTGRRIYFPRRGERRPTNWEEVEAMMREFGFEIFDYEASDREFEVFRDATLVAGPHGSGLTHFAVCKPGTKIFEIVPTDHAYAYWYSLAVAGGHDYAYLGARSVQHREPRAVGPSPYDYYVDPAELRAALATLVAEVEPEAVIQT